MYALIVREQSVPGPEYPCAMCSETYSQSGYPSKKELNTSQTNSIYVDIMVHYVWKINVYPWVLEI